ncbi:uncharacterized protein LOC131952336 [Physella acuta]|uniref:uncharacterized protein LOC131952336 n=1 Tax=Physella acuta TaxID=109671 RepID=UPI0027DE690F|nr:uncharacterized protein LOC131952336 [Physella acuta]
MTFLTFFFGKQFLSTGLTYYTSHHPGADSVFRVFLAIILSSLQCSNCFVRSVFTKHKLGVIGTLLGFLHCLASLALNYSVAYLEPYLSIAVTLSEPVILNLIRATYTKIRFPHITIVSHLVLVFGLVLVLLEELKLERLHIVGVLLALATNGVSSLGLFVRESVRGFHPLTTPFSPWPVGAVLVWVLCQLCVAVGVYYLEKIETLPWGTVHAVCMLVFSGVCHFVGDMITMYLLPKVISVDKEQLLTQVQRTVTMGLLFFTDHSSLHQYHQALGFSLTVFGAVTSSVWNKTTKKKKLPANLNSESRTLITYRNVDLLQLRKDLFHEDRDSSFCSLSK